jgi:hypothetical protein
MRGPNEFYRCIAKSIREAAVTPLNDRRIGGLAVDVPLLVEQWPAWERYPRSAIRYQNGTVDKSQTVWELERHETAQ